MIDARTTHVEQTEELAAALAALVRPRDIIVLSGEMGAGKTAFVRGFAAGVGVSSDETVSSPTFTLVHTYDSGRLVVHHADLYRLGRLSDVEDLGLRELADLGDIVIVEWGNVAEEVLGDHLVVSLEADDDEEDPRRVVVSVVGHTWDSRWEQLQRALAKWGN